MENKDLLQRFLFDKAPIRGEYIHLDKSYQTIIHQHDYPELIRNLLGEALCVAGLLSAIIKFSGRLTVQFRGHGQLKLLLAQCDNQFQLRGLVKWDGELSYDSLMESFQHGVLVIMLDSGPKKNRYQGIVTWRGNSLAESIEGYFRDSEQLATRIWLTVDDTKATGFLLQAVPINNESGIDMEIPEWERIIQLTTHLPSQDMLTLDCNTLLTKLYPEEDIRIFPPVNMVFHCSCSRKRSEDALLLLSKEEIEDELKTKQALVVTCDFCNKKYIFDRSDIERMSEHKDTPPPDIHLH